MMDINYFDNIIKNRLSQKRYQHSLNVAKTAVILANRFNGDARKAEIAGLLHDITKNDSLISQLQMCEKFGIIFSDTEKATPAILHAITGASFLQNELNISDLDIINAVKYHTTGKKEMSLLEKIIYLADFIEPSRSFDGIEKVRALANNDIDFALEEALALSISEVVNKKNQLHINSVECYNNIISINTKKRIGVKNE